MTLKCFYSWVKSECKEKRHTVSSYNIPLRRCCATGRLLRQRSSQSDLIHYTHLTHTRNPCLLKMQIQFRGRGRERTRTPTFASHGTLCLHQLIDWYCATESTAVQASRPGDRSDTRCISVVQTSCFSQFILEFNEHLPAFCLHSPSLWIRAQWDFLQTVNIHLHLQYNLVHLC